jgi:hypothetical protein
MSNPGELSNLKVNTYSVEYACKLHGVPPSHFRKPDRIPDGSRPFSVSTDRVPSDDNWAALVALESDREPQCFVGPASAITFEATT